MPGICIAMVGMARHAVPARVVAGGTNCRATPTVEEVAPLHAARTSQRDVPTTLNRYDARLCGRRDARRCGKQIHGRSNERVRLESERRKPALFHSIIRKPKTNRNTSIVLIPRRWLNAAFRFSSRAGWGGTDVCVASPDVSLGPRECLESSLSCGRFGG